MGFPQDKGQKDKVHNTGEIVYVSDGTNFYPLMASTVGHSTMGSMMLAQREPFIFYPGSTALANGGVAAGTRSSSGTTISGTVASSTYWGSWMIYQPARVGKIDGLSSGGIIQGEICAGLACGVGTGVAKVTAQIANTANTSAPTTFLALSSTITCTTATSYSTFQMPCLQCDTVMNSIPFSVRMGVQHSQGGSTIVFQMMEDSYIIGEFEPGT